MSTAVATAAGMNEQLIEMAQDRDHICIALHHNRADKAWTATLCNDIPEAELKTRFTGAEPEEAVRAAFVAWDIYKMEKAEAWESLQI